MASQADCSSAEKLALFRACFCGLPQAYGTYDPVTGHVRQVKQPVTEEVLRAHLQGRQPYGVYLLEGERTRAVVADFDFTDLQPVIDFVHQARQYDLPAYIERSKSKGHHVWLFFTPPGVPAVKARAVVRRVLGEIDQPAIEIFPKQDRLDAHCRYGNFINAPLFGRLVPAGRTVFVRPSDPTRPVADQWRFLANIERIAESHLDELIEVNELMTATPYESGGRSRPAPRRPTYGLPPCARRMLVEGVTDFQRVSCFRLAVHLKSAGLPQDLAVSALLAWATKNRPINGKRIITPYEVRSQTSDAYSGAYRGCGCEEPAAEAFCDPDCPVRARRQRASASPTAPLANHEPERRTAMSETSNNRPVKTFRARGLEVAIWEREVDGQDGCFLSHSVTFKKSYKDPQTGAWTDSSTFFPDDLPRLRLLLDKAYERIMLGEGEARREAAGVSKVDTSEA